jgi:hypothetical protein
MEERDAMERRDHGERYQAWREAEARGDERTADAALASLFEALPLEAPSEGFAAATLDRVRARMRSELRAEALSPAPAPAGARWAAAVLGLLSVGTLGLSILAVRVLPLLEVGGAVAIFNSILGAVGEWIASGIALWGQAAEWSAVLARVVTVPGVAGTLVLAAATAAFALSLLRRILLHDPHEKEPSHV